ncbi:hypothetical protein HIM_11776 [Hirsutella minnesotensis 3608]|uniref:Uncharacterized protein n=1 Tax=Hirsutella minnesotensis 3608 TaxID=1043627 RepID=A0A0F7ZFB2_9HYPO|nr:hypothetical protein HIM_11776 [Hirsutella minnesotensis 3608]
MASFVDQLSLDVDKQPQHAMDRKSTDLLWGSEFVPKSSGAGSLVDRFAWLAEKSSTSRVLDLAESKKKLWCPLPPCIGAGEMFVVAICFAFEEAEAMDACWKNLRGRLAVAADMWLKWPDDSVDGDNSGAMILLFDPSAPLVGPMQTDEVVRAVQHYMGYCATKALMKAGNKKRSYLPWWKAARTASIELVPEKEKEAWLASRQFLLDTCGQLGRCLAQSFRCEVPCRERDFYDRGVRNAPLDMSDAYWEDRITVD